MSTPAGTADLWTRRASTRDIAVILAFWAFAGWLTRGMWPDPAVRVLALNREDQVLLEWFLGFATRIVDGGFSLITDRLNAPDGVNLLANGSIIVPGVLFAPISLVFGAPVSFALLVAANLAGTASAWYLLYARKLAFRRPAAVVGAALCGFAPGMVSQSNGHVHVTAQWLVPAMVWCVIRLARAADPEGPGNERWRRDLVAASGGLAGLIAVQLFIGEEVLFLTALSLATLVIGCALVQPAEVRRRLPRFAAGMSLAAALATLVLAYPLWVQFAGPQHVPNSPFRPEDFSADLASFPAFSPLSVFGSDPIPYPDRGLRARLTAGPAEYNTFLGWPLIAVVVGCLVWLRREPLAWVLKYAAVMMAALSLGPHVTVNGDRTWVPGPYTLLHGLPIVEQALPTRFALALVPLIATLLAFGFHRVLSVPVARHEPTSQSALVLRPVAAAALAAALLPLTPGTVPTAHRSAVPPFITEGHWRDCVTPGGVLVTVPLPTPAEPDPMRWAAAANGRFAIPEGFFIGPYGDGGRAAFGIYPRPTSRLLAGVAETGEVPPVGDTERLQASADLSYWGASCVALTPGPREEQLRITLEALLGSGERIAGTWTWKIPQPQ